MMMMLIRSICLACRSVYGAVVAPAERVGSMPCQLERTDAAQCVATLMTGWRVGIGNINIKWSFEAA